MCCVCDDLCRHFLDLTFDCSTLYVRVLCDNTCFYCCHLHSSLIVTACLTDGDVELQQLYQVNDVSDWPRLSDVVTSSSQVML